LFYEAISNKFYSMELRHLRYFTAVAEELHFARAAERLNIAAPTLSQQIRSLETLLGARLFSRKTKSAVVLTHAGKRFLAEAQATLKQAAHAELVGRRAARGDTGSIALGYVLSASCGGFLQEAIVSFKKSHPDVSLNLRQMETFPQLKAIIDGVLDIGVMRVPRRYPSGLTGFVIDRQPFRLALPEDHRLAGRKSITPAMLEGEDFIAAPLEIEVGFWGNIAAVIPADIPLRIVERAPDAFTVLTLVAAKAGLGVVSGSLTRLNVPGIVYREITGAARQADHAVVYRKQEGAPVIIALLKSLRKNASVRR